MWNARGNTSAIKKGGGNGLIAVAIDKDKGSQHALKWAVENLLARGQTVLLIHVLNRSPSSHDEFNTPALHKQHLEKITRDLFVTFHCYCTRKDIYCLDIILEDVDIAKALTEYVSYSAIECLVLGTPSRHGFIRKFKADIPSSVSKAAPDFCTVYVISKGKISSARNASRAAPFASPVLDQIQKQNAIAADTLSLHSNSLISRDKPGKPRQSFENSVRSPFARARGYGKSFADFSESESEKSFISSERPSTDRGSSVLNNDIFPDSARTSAVSSSSGSFASLRLGLRWPEQASASDISQVSLDQSSPYSYTSQPVEDVEAEMRRLKLELKQTMELYSTACKEALQAKQKTVELHRWRDEEERRIEEARLAEDGAKAILERERTKCRAAVEAAEAAKRIAELEAQQRVNAEIKAIKEAEDIKKMLDTLAQSNVRYRKYTIEEIEAATDFFSQSRKIGEGGYGPVFKCHLDHTPVAVKILRPDAAQGRSQFQQEIEVLSCIRHPNMVLLLGACPEYGILVYEYMAKGSLEDCLFRKGNTPPLSWQLRFRIAAEIATGILFLHQTKPEPIVHRDLKPGNILLDQNYVSKISDVGLARLVPAVAENVTQCRITSAAGTFCYIDPEYQQTGMLGVKSDVYSLGVMLLQLITAKPAMGLTHLVERSIEKETFEQVLDPAVPDWPVEEALSFAKMCLRCAELRRKDRPDLGKEVLPELNRLRDLAEENDNHFSFAGSAGPSPYQSQLSMTPEVMSDAQPSESMKSQSSTSSKIEE
ncbi:hypothetical protein SLE2022_379900 [Rubroshorea leprosula]